ncbi:MAG: helix-turn-helix domain-containing protein [Bdellovibrionaceae bacterium]|nr:helix-turn-helix domain-containing protein [Pseudobdellovibrionaceae bacterium]
MKETSELLKKTRAEKHLTIEEISSQTKIQLHILRALEEGELGDFRSIVFVKGFLKQYAKALGLDPVAVLKTFEEENSASRGGSVQKSNPVAKLDDNEIRNKTNVLWFRTSSKFLTVGGILVIFSLVTAIYFFSMKLISYTQETRTETSDATAAAETPEAIDAATNNSVPTSSTEELTKEESLSLPETAPTKAIDKDPKSEEKPAPAAAPTGKPKMVTVEAFENVELVAQWSTGKKESIKLKNNGKHIFYYADKLKLEINNGGGVGITTHEKEIGVPGELGQPKTMNFE